MEPKNLQTSLYYDVFSDDGSYFDLDFSLPRDSSNSMEEEEEEEEEENDEAPEFEFDFSICRPATHGDADADEEAIISSPAANIFFHDVPVSGEMSSQNSSTTATTSSSFSSNGIKISLLRTATRLKIGLLRLTRSVKSGPESQKNSSSRLFTVRFIRVGDAPLMSFFSTSKRAQTMNSQSCCDDADERGLGLDRDRDRNKANQLIHKYVRMMMMKRQSHQLEKSNQNENPTQLKNNGGSRSQSQLLSFSLTGNLKTVCRNLAKTRNQRNGTGIFTGTGSGTASATEPKISSSSMSSYRNESTLMDLQNAIQGAIAHCKQSNSMNHRHHVDGPSCTKFEAVTAAGNA